MQEQWVDIDVEGQPMHTLTATPEGEGPFPAVVVIHHVGGLDTFHQDVVRRLGVAGFVAAAPRLYHRQNHTIEQEIADLPTTSPVWRNRSGIMSQQLLDTQVIADVNAALAYLQSLPQVQADRIGITGFCIGGRIAYLMASVNPAFKAAVPCYPSGTMRAWGNGPTPFDQLANIKCPVLGLFGAEDTSPSPEEVKKIEDELTRHGVTHQSHSFPDAPHAFMDYTSPHRYQDEAAREAWSLAVSFFQEHLSGVPAAR